MKEKQTLAVFWKIHLISSLEGFLSTAINGKINAQTC